MRNGTDVVVAFGGDGTVNEVVNGLLTDGVHEGVPALGVVPAGSTNVFARALGLPTVPIEATGVVLEALRTGTRRPVSMGCVTQRGGDRYFVFAAGMGLDAAIVAGVEKQRNKGRRSTDLLYARVGVREFYRIDRRHPRLRIELPDGTRYDDIFFAIVANTDPWTYIGNRPLRPTPEAGFDSGLAVYARRRMSTPGLLISMARLAREEPKIGRRGAYVIHDLDGLTVISDEPMPVQVDGDYLGVQEKLEFHAAPRAVRVLVAP
jgi:diacylglycerol kinase family enzyme